MIERSCASPSVFAVFRKQTKPSFHSGSNRFLDMLAVDRDHSGSGMIEPEDAAQQLRATRTNQSGDPKISPRRSDKADVARIGGSLNLIDLDPRLAGLVRHRGKQIVHVATDHQRNDLVIGNFRDAPRANVSPITQHGVRVSHLTNFFQKVADVDDADTTAL